MVRIAIVEKEKCHPQKCGGYWCIGVCPVNRNEEECIQKNEQTTKIVIDEKLCIGCGICVKCPFDAIKIINLPEKLKEKPVIRFGINSFELFRLPVPKENKIIGIIGRNGIGKSTALDILSNSLKPNFGDYTKKLMQNEILDNFSGTILGNYLKKLYNNEIIISYKPQRVDLIPDYYKGTISDLIRHADQKEIGIKLLKELDLYDIKDRDVKTLSGGELQKLAIISTMCKKASFYYFDEPASFLDITNRIKVAKLIRELSRTSSVIVIEHDIATLDYISDEIQIFYGEQSAYGIISQNKSVRRGINEYLDGFLPDDNVKFRPYPIRFYKPIDQKLREEILFDFPKLEKDYAGFRLRTNPGKLRKGEVLAIMGSNGLGKSTFLKMLSGIEKPTKGNIMELKISYKPQNLVVAEGNVKDYLKDIAKQEFESGWYKQNIIEKLNIKHILNNELKTLSGGELQKINIAACLSSNVDVYALDEPSAFIDIEDRLNIAEVIKEFCLKKECCAIVVDHDIQFIEYLADSILVFEGTPGIEGSVFGPVEKREGMNRVLKSLGITYRKEKDTNRPRINKPDSQLDVDQKKKGEYYCV